MSIDHAGQRIGNWFLWLDVDDVTVRGEKIALITARRAVIGGEVLAREVATPEMAKSLRHIADKIDAALEKK